METMTDMQKVAGEALAYFVRKPGTDERPAFFTLTDDAPEWITALVREAHGDMLPDDFRYEAIRHAVSYIEEVGDEENAHGFADSMVDVYTSDLLAWLGSNTQRVGYVDEARSELGGRNSIIEEIAQGQYEELSEVYHSVYASLNGQL